MSVQHHGAGVYSFAHRLKYNDFCGAAEDTIRTVILSARPDMRALRVRVETNGGASAAIAMSEQGRSAPGSHGNAREHFWVANVRLPTLDLDTVVSADYATRLLGFVIHECLHGVWTDQVAAAGMRGICARKIGVSEAALHGMTNVLEDYLIEWSATDPTRPVVGNAAALLGNLNDLVIAPSAVEAVTTAPDPVTQGRALILTQINRHGRQIAPALDAVAAQALAAADPRVRDLVTAALDAAEANPSWDYTNKRVRIAADLMAALRALGPIQQDGQQQDGQQQDGQQQDGQQQDGPTREQALAAAAPRGGGTAKPSPTQAGVARAGTFDDWVADLVSRTDPATGYGRLRTGLHSLDAVARRLDARAMTTAMRQGLQSVECIQHERRLQTGRMDRRAAVRQGLGAQDVFARRTVTPGMTTALILMVDGSASMQNVFGAHDVSRWLAAIAFAGVFATAAEAAGARVACAAFAGWDFGGTDEQTVFWLKNWQDRAAKFVGRAQSWSQSKVVGNTPMVREARWARTQLEAQRVERRVCIWLCDGQPDEGVHALAREFDLQRRAGVEHYGVMIEQDVDAAQVIADQLFGAGCAVGASRPQDVPRAVQRMLEARGRG